MGKNLLLILMGNIFNLGLGLINGMILPYFLSINTYAAMKTYALYLTFSGICSLGYNDGMILKYGGKDISELNVVDVGKNFFNFVYLNISFALLFIGIGIVLKNNFWIMLAVGGIANNIIAYYKSFYQSVGKFKEYSKALNVDKILLLMLYLVMVFIVKTDDFNVYICGQIVVYIVTVCYIGKQLNRDIPYIKYRKLDYKEIFLNIKAGFVILCSNMAATLYTAIDRFFVSKLMSNKEFAVYAFVVTLEGIIGTFLFPIKVAMFNYFCKKNDNEIFKKIKGMTLIWSFLIIAMAFPVKFIIEKFLVNYLDAIPVVFILFAMEPFYTITSGIYANVYKVRREQKKYFIQMVIMLGLAVLLNFTFCQLNKSIVSISFATLVTAIVWLAICEKDVKAIRFSLNEWMAEILLTITFVFCGIKLSTVSGFLIYIVLFVLIVVGFMRKDFRTLIDFILNTINNVFKLKNK